MGPGWVYTESTSQTLTNHKMSDLSINQANLRLLASGQRGDCKCSGSDGSWWAIVGARKESILLPQRTVLAVRKLRQRTLVLGSRHLLELIYLFVSAATSCSLEFHCHAPSSRSGIDHSTMDLFARQTRPLRLSHENVSGRVQYIACAIPDVAGIRSFDMSQASLCARTFCIKK